MIINGDENSVAGYGSKLIDSSRISTIGDLNSFFRTKGINMIGNRRRYYDN